MKLTSFEAKFDEWSQIGNEANWKPNAITHKLWWQICDSHEKMAKEIMDPGNSVRS